VEPVFSYAGKIQEFLGEKDLFFCLNITIQVMAIANVSSGDQDSVPAFLQRLYDKKRIDPGRTHDPYRPHVGRVLKSRYPGQVCGRIRTPVAQKR
jgi:hypothetical protein